MIFIIIIIYQRLIIFLYCASLLLVNGLSRPPQPNMRGCDDGGDGHTLAYTSLTPPLAFSPSSINTGFFYFFNDLSIQK